MPREISHIIDAGYALCFGAAPRGMSHLRELFGGGLGAPPAVKRELDRLRNTGRNSAVRSAAEHFAGRTEGVLVDAPLYEGDLAERDLALTCIPCRSDPGRHQGVSEPGTLVTEVTTGKDAGEAEGIAAAFRRSVPLLVNDQHATKHARARGLQTEDAASSIRRLAISPKQKYQLYLDMERSVGNAGAPVKGWLWYRENGPKTV
jgi:hypothetical protein